MPTEPPPSQSDSTDSGADAPASRRRLTAVLYVCLLGAGIFAAWQVHEFYFSPQLRSERGDLTESISRPGSAGGAFAEANAVVTPSELADDPLGLVGVKTLADEPGGLIPPPGAKRHRSIQLRSADSMEQQAMYAVAADSESVAKHYRYLLDKQGFELLLNEVGPLGDLRLIARKGDRRVIVSVRKNKESDKTVQLFVTMIDTGTSSGGGLSVPDGTSPG